MLAELKEWAQAKCICAGRGVHGALQFWANFSTALCGAVQLKP